jgi:hypothetical protein
MREDGAMEERDAAGWAVLTAAVERARAVLGERLAGAYAVGSLVHGGFAEDVSDVDGVLIVDRCDTGIAAAVDEIVAATRAGDGAGLADRLSLFWGDWATFGAPPDTARLPPIVRLDLLADGVVLHGAPPPAGLPRPTPDDLIRESAAFAAGRLEREPLPRAAALLAAGRRPLTKTVLFPVRFLATACAGLTGSNEAAVAWYVADGRPHAQLARAALGWRTEAIADEAAAERLLEAHLRGLYAEALDGLAAHAAVAPAVRARLDALRDRLTV